MFDFPLTQHHGRYFLPGPACPHHNVNGIEKILYICSSFSERILTPSSSMRGLGNGGVGFPPRLSRGESPRWA